jgi:transposase
MKCPRCGKEAAITHKEWDYSVFHVKLFNCSNCQKKFKAYYKKGELSHTIPKSK